VDVCQQDSTKDCLWKNFPEAASNKAVGVVLLSRVSSQYGGPSQHSSNNTERIAASRWLLAHCTTDYSQPIGHVAEQDAEACSAFEPVLSCTIPLCSLFQPEDMQRVWPSKVRLKERSSYTLRKALMKCPGSFISLTSFGSLRRGSSGRLPDSAPESQRYLWYWCPECTKVSLVSRCASGAPNRTIM
jgi:hypothetical protein